MTATDSLDAYVRSQHRSQTPNVISEMKSLAQQKQQSAIQGAYDQLHNTCLGYMSPLEAQAQAEQEIRNLGVYAAEMSNDPIDTEILEQVHYALSSQGPVI